MVNATHAAALHLCDKSQQQDVNCFAIDPPAQFWCSLQVAKGLGPVATVIVRSGTLRLGDPIVVGTEHGKVSACCCMQLLVTTYG